MLRRSVEQLGSSTFNLLKRYQNVNGLFEFDKFLLIFPFP